jgi:hypothetical protein
LYICNCKFKVKVKLNDGTATRLWDKKKGGRQEKEWKDTVEGGTLVTPTLWGNSDHSE